MKKRVLSLCEITFDPLKKEKKIYLSMEKKLIFFIRNLRAFCIYFLQVIPSNLKD
jgi:hypothetical protein